MYIQCIYIYYVLFSQIPKSNLLFREARHFTR